MKKKSSYCKELGSNSKKSLDFECRPPKSCFTCPYPDCVCERQSRTQEETLYIKCAGFKK